MVDNASYFIFNDISSRDFRLALCTIGNDKEEELNLGLDYEVDTYSVRNIVFDYGAQYKGTLAFNMTVIHEDGSEFTRNQVREIMAWLDDCQDELRWLTFYDKETERNINYLCRITSKKKVKVGERIIGLKLEVTCDSPYAYSDKYKVSYDHTEDNNMNGYHEIYVDSDTEVYPNITLDCAYGSENLFNLTMTNKSIIIPKKYTDEESTYQEFVMNIEPLPYVGGGAPRETFYIDSHNQIIESSSNVRDVYYNISNFIFPTLTAGLNKITITSEASATCIMKIEYRCRYKVGEF